MKNRSKFYAGVNKTIGGLNRNGGLPLTHFTLATLIAALALAKKAQKVFQKSRRLKRDAVDAQQKAKAAGMAWAILLRSTLSQYLTDSWNLNWVEAGFKTPNSLAIPGSLPELQELIRTATAYLTDNPQYENADPKVNVTAAEGTKQDEGLQAAIDGVTACHTHQRKMKDDRTTVETLLEAQMRGLIGELKLILKEGDPRWLDFIAEVPADTQRPEAVQDLQMSGSGPGELEGDWEPSARSDRFLVEIMVLGVDAAFRRVATVRDENVTIPGLPLGADVKVRVLAANEAGESAPSEEVTVQVPLAKAA